MTDIVNVSQNLQRGSRQRLLLSQQLINWLFLSHSECERSSSFTWKMFCTQKFRSPS